MNRSHDLIDLARRQHGLVARRQLTQLGISRWAVTRALDSGRLERLTPRVLRIAGSQNTAHQRAMTACLDVQGSVAASSAAAMWQMPGFFLEPVHVLATRQPHRDAKRAGPMHSSIRLCDEDVMTLDGIPVTTPVRTLRDLAGRVHAEKLSQVCDRMLSQRLLRLAALHALLDDLPLRGGAPGTAAMRRLVLARPDGYRPADSNLERRFETIVEEAGEAPFERQVEVGDDEGCIGRVDFLDRDLGVIVEVQSHLFHGGLVDAARDAERVARLRRAGWIVLEVTDEEVWHRKSDVIARVRAARTAARHTKLARRGAQTATS
jgi:very-short-patch-repair endonuclease